ncbi:MULTISPECIES: helix-turn-helix transcriptional regulator [Lysinibacillus]|nr:MULTISPECIES: helix-turn-helix transcriptional regulator [Lysinibacillus]MDD1502115.1 helix-turn-helix transcriptional regulator [Lysinibacillus sp. CNPSo 3705]
MKEGVYMGMAKKIKMLMVEKDLTLSELAEKMGTSQPNISNKLKRDNFNEKELNLIAEVLGVKYEANFVLEDGRKI